MRQVGLNRDENQLRTWGAFLLLALAWGTSFMFIKIALRTVQPFTLVAARLLIGWIALFLVLRLRRARLPREWSLWGHLLVIGVINVAIPFVLIVWAESGEQGLDSGVAAILNSTVPLFSIIISGLLLQVEVVDVGRVFGLLVGFGGVILLLSRGLASDWSGLFPYAAVVVAAISYAAGSAYARRHLQEVRPVALAAGQLLVADAVVIAAALLLEDPGQQRFPLPTVGALLWLGLIGSCLAYLLYFHILQQWGATRTTLVTYLLPVVGVTAGVIFLNESLDWRILAGGALILSGIGAVNLRP